VCKPKRSFHRLGDEHETLAEYLRRNGYSTAGVAANSTVLVRSFNLHQGFDYYAVRIPPNPGTVSSNLVLRERFAKIVMRVAKPRGNPELYLRAEDINNEVIPLIDQLQSSPKPFFLFVNYMDAHTPYDPPPPYDSLFPTPDRHNVDSAEYYSIAADVMKLARKLPDNLRERLIAGYDGELSYLDYHVGHLVDHLRSRKLLDNTLLIITSDHGEAFGERSFVGHGLSVYQDQVHVPLVIKWPGTGRGERIRRPVSLIDIFPTVLGTLNLPVPTKLTGQTLTRAHPPELRLVVAERYPCPDLYRLHPRFQSVQRAALWGRWKLVQAAGAEAELYEIGDESTNKAHSEAPRVLALARQLEAVRKYEQHNVHRLRSHPAVLSSDEVERLKSLGYVQ
jgi:arylsulfatase A-like enzyme